MVGLQLTVSSAKCQADQGNYRQSGNLNLIIARNNSDVLIEMFRFNGRNITTQKEWLFQKCEHIPSSPCVLNIQTNNKACIMYRYTFN